MFDNYFIEGEAVYFSSAIPQLAQIQEGIYYSLESQGEDNSKSNDGKDHQPSTARYSFSFSFDVDEQSTSESSPLVHKRKRIYKKRVRIPVDIDTKNIPKFFGTRISQHPSFSHISFKSIKEIREICRNKTIQRQLQYYFKSNISIQDVMDSFKLRDHKVVIRHIKSFLKGITNPRKFMKIR